MIELEDVVQSARDFSRGTPSMDQLSAWVFQQDWSSLNWREHLPIAAKEAGYSRNIVALEPFEIALLRWNPGASSAIHLHAGFWGFVVCLSGKLEHHGFTLESGELVWQERVVAFEQGVLAEPDGTIHRLLNGSASEELVTLHLYAPALADLDGLKLFDPDRGDIYTCGASAPAASLNLSAQHYQEVLRNAFSMRPLDATTSHSITPVVPKPDAHAVSKLLAAYYRAQADDYDRLDRADARRRAYTQGVNVFIADQLKALDRLQVVSRVLDVGCGTGRRAMEIKELSGLGYAIEGTDLSPEMAAIAAKRGVLIHERFWEGLQDGGRLDAITFLYAFSHLPTRAKRLNALVHLKSVLRPGGMLFVDVFNREDPHEWGPKLEEDFDAWFLGQQGYEPGDVFYSRVGTTELAFLHYTDMDEMTKLLHLAGFDEVECMRIGYAHKPGQEVEEGGSLMFYARNPE